MRKTILILIITIEAVFSYAQTGTIGDPFTSLNQAAGVTSPGVHYFNMGGSTFDTQVDANGYVQVAIDFGNGVGNLAQGTSLNTTTRGILNTTVLAVLTETIEVRISSSTGNLDVTTTNATIISRIQSNTTLHQGSADNGINNNWSGTNATYITCGSGCSSNHGPSLRGSIIHLCGNGNGMHWIPSINKQMEKHSNDEISSTDFLQLWVKGDNITLPIELLNFNAKLLDNHFIELNWQTASEINNDYFTIERSIDGVNWKKIKEVDGAGNSSSLLYYYSVDNKPYLGISYYRLKQTDFDGQFAYSQIRSVNIESDDHYKIEMYPNPSNKRITIVGSKNELEDVIICNSLGQDVTMLTQRVDNNKTKVIIDLTKLSSGIYFVKTKTTTNKIYKL